MLRGGDGLRLEDGRVVEVLAEPEPLAEIRAADPLAMTRIAWHLGNRHLLTEMLPKALRIRRDPVIEAMADRSRGSGDCARGAVQSRRRRLREGGERRSAETAMTMTITPMIMEQRGHRHDHAHDHHATTMPITTMITITAPAIIQIISTSMGIDIDLEPGRPALPMTAGSLAMISRSPPSDAADADAALLPLMLWLSPAFPVGSFAYSQGLEWAVENGDIHDARSLGGWLVDLLTFGAPRADAILFAECFRAAAAEDWTALAEANAFAVALANSAERRLETTAQGRRLCSRRSRRLGLRTSASAFPGMERVAYPAAVASASAGHGLPLEASLQAFILAQSRSRRLGRRAPWADRPDRRPEDPGDACPSHTRARARGVGLRP